jgi:hypothetical protein
MKRLYRRLHNAGFLRRDSSRHYGYAVVPSPQKKNPNAAVAIRTKKNLTTCVLTLYFCRVKMMAQTTAIITR